jgi:hypothetical protein
MERLGGPRGKAILRTAYDWTKNHPFASPSRLEGAALATATEDYRRGVISADELRRALGDVRELASEAREIADLVPAVRETLPTLRKASMIAEAAMNKIDGNARALEANLEAIARDPWSVGLDGVLAFLQR